jgi:hypothetical protein
MFERSPGVVLVLVASAAIAMGDSDSGLRTSVACCGDVNHDGVPDLVVASRDLAHAPVVWILSGKDGSVLHVIRGNPGSQVEFVSAPGDLDGDGLPEILISSVPDKGHYDIEQRGGKPLVRQRWEWDAAPESRVISSKTRNASFSWPERVSATLIQDRNGDGTLDLLLIAQTKSGQDPATARICSGKDGRTILEFAAPRDGRLLQGAAAIVGDVDGDGIEDFALPFAIESAPKKIETGVLLCSGKSGAELWRSVRKLENAVPSIIVSRLADIDGDGTLDLLVAQESRWVRAISGKRGTMLYEIISKHGSDVDAFGSSLDVVGDVDGDHVPDWVVGANEQFGKEFFDEGYVWLCSGKRGTQSKQLFSSKVAGVDVCGMGDVDGDGIPDVALHSQDAELLNDPRGNPIIAVVSGKDCHVAWQQETQALRKSIETQAPPNPRELRR